MFTDSANERLGQGAFGDVFKGFDRKRLQQVAIKRVHNSVLDKYGEEFIRCLGNEANILQEMGDGVHTVAIIDCFQTSNHVNIIMEFCDGGTLRGKLDKYANKYFEEDLALTYFAEIVEGLYAMHRSGRMHRDLKLENIFFKEGHCKIGDFGFATKHPTSEQYVGTPEYMAPEIFVCGDGNTYDKQVDIWALGIMLHEMLFIDRPYTGPQTQLADKIKANPYKPPSHPPTSDATKDLLVRMLEFDPKKRIRIEDIKVHPAIRSKIKEKDLMMLVSSKSDDGQMIKRLSADYDLPDNLKLSLTQSLTNDYVHRINKKLDNYRKCCGFFLNFSVTLLPYMKKEKDFILDDLHVFRYYLLKFAHNKFSFLIYHFDRKECPRKLFKPVEADYWSQFVKSENFEKLKKQTETGRNLVEKLFSDFRTKELPMYLDRAGRNRGEIDTIYNKNIESDCTASFTGKLAEATYVLNKMSQTKKDIISEELSKILLDLELSKLIEEYMDNFEAEIDLESFKQDRDGTTRNNNINIKKYVKVRTW